MPKQHLSREEIAQMMTSGNLLTTAQEAEARGHVLRKQRENVALAIAYFERELPRLDEEIAQLAEERTDSPVLALGNQASSARKSTPEARTPTRRGSRSGGNKAAAVLDFLKRNDEATLQEIHQNLVELGLDVSGNKGLGRTRSIIQSLKVAGRQIRSRREDGSGNVKVYYLEKDEQNTAGEDRDEEPPPREFSRAGPSSSMTAERRRMIGESHQRVLMATSNHSSRQVAKRDGVPSAPAKRLKIPMRDGDDWQTLIMAIIVNNNWEIGWRDLADLMTIKREARLVGFDLSTATEPLVLKQVKDTLELLERKGIIDSPLPDDIIKRARGAEPSDPLAPEPGKAVSNDEEILRAIIEVIEKFPFKWNWDELTSLFLTRKPLGRSGWFFPAGIFSDEEVRNKLAYCRKSLNGQLGKDEEGCLFPANKFPVFITS